MRSSIGTAALRYSGGIRWPLVRVAPPGPRLLCVEIQFEELRPAHLRHVATGSLACPRCDAPVALAGSHVAPADPLGCPYCDHGAAVRDFLSLTAPSRPARVELRLVHRPR